MLVRKVMRELFNEASCLFHMRHPNLSALKGLCLESGNYCLVLEYCDGGDLWKYLHSFSEGGKGEDGKEKELPWYVRWRLAHEAALGVLHLHKQSPPRIHQALKSPNLLLTSELHIKVADFGFAGLKKDAQSKSKLA